VSEDSKITSSGERDGDQTHFTGKPSELDLFESLVTEVNGNHAQETIDTEFVEQADQDWFTNHLSDSLSLDESDDPTVNHPGFQ